MQNNLITLRPVEPKDSPYYFKWINNKSLVLLSANYKPITFSEHEKWFNHIPENKHSVIFSIVENHANQLIGSCSLRNINADHNHAELQIRVGEMDFQNKGLGSEAVLLLVDYGFTTLRLKRIYLNVFSTNARAIKSYQKCHFELEGIQKKAAKINGEYVDVCLMAIINPAI